VSETVLWGGFSVIVVVMLVLDLGVFNRRAHVPSFKEAGLTSLLWISVAAAFNVWVFYTRGDIRGLEFMTGYLVELALSVDNLFVFLVIFAYFRVHGEWQHKVLFWGIVGVVVMRGALITLGVALIHQFEWLIYGFGLFLIYTAFKLATAGDEGVHPEKNPVVSLFRRLMPVSNDYDSNKFFTRHAGKLMATPLLIVLLVVETTDFLFALDSIPAIFAVTTNPFIIFSSNIFAVLGLRSLYFLLAGMLTLFRYLKVGLSLVLGFIGVKMLLPAIPNLHLEIPIGASLGVIAGILGIAIAASIIVTVREGNFRVRTLEEAEAEAQRINAEAAHETHQPSPSESERGQQPTPAPLSE
jgi:tellurite resistance protein TerC